MCLGVVDFFHAAEHLSDALAAAYGDGTREARRRFADLRHVLLEEPGGVENLCSWAQSERFDRAWAMLAATYQADVTLLNNVVPIHTALTATTR